VLSCPSRGLESRGDSELLVEAAEVVTHGMRAQFDSTCDPNVVPALFQKFQEQLILLCQCDVVVPMDRPGLARDLTNDDGQQR